MKSKEEKQKFLLDLIEKHKPGTTGYYANPTRSNNWLVGVHNGNPDEDYNLTISDDLVNFFIAGSDDFEACEWCESKEQCDEDGCQLEERYS